MNMICVTNDSPSLRNPRLGNMIHTSDLLQICRIVLRVECEVQANYLARGFRW
jgi:hypothetical protein